MDGAKRWVTLIVAAVVAVGVLGVVATQLELSRAKEEPCGTALRIDLRLPTLLRGHASDLEGADDAVRRPDDEVRTRAEALRARADEVEDRCTRRQAVALLGLGAGGVVATAAVALAAYQLGRRAGARAALSGGSDARR